MNFSKVGTLSIVPHTTQPNQRSFQMLTGAMNAGTVGRRHGDRRQQDHRIGGVARRDRGPGGRALRGQHGVRQAAVLAVRRRGPHTRVQQDQVQNT